MIALIIGEGSGTFLRPKFFRIFFTFSSKRELFSKVLRIFAHNMKPNIIEDQIFEFELFEEDGSVLMAAARKAVEHGHRVYILPNPKGIRTADFIFERKGVRYAK